MLSDNEEQRRPAQEAPILITDDDSSDFEGPVLIIDEDSCDQGQAASNGNAMDISDVFQHNSSHGVGEPNLGENLCQPPNVAEATVEIPDEEPTPVVEQPRKRKSKTKNICVTPGKPFKSRMPDLLNTSRPPSAPAVPAMPSPWIGLSCQVCLSCLPTLLPFHLFFFPNCHFSNFLMAKGDSHPIEKDLSGNGRGTPTS